MSKKSSKTPKKSPIFRENYFRELPEDLKEKIMELSRQMRKSELYEQEQRKVALFLFADSKKNKITF